MFRFSLAATAVLLTTSAFAQAPLAFPATGPVTLVAEGGHDMHHMDAAEMHAGPAVTLGALEISGAFSRATLPNAPVGGGYLSITNTGASDDRLVSVATPVAGTSQIHEMKMDGDVMRMNELPDGLAIPAGETVELAPGGYHLMFMDLQQPLVEGESFPVTLTFEKAGSVEVELQVGAPAAKGPAMDHSMHSEIVTMTLEDFA